MSSFPTYQNDSRSLDAARAGMDPAARRFLWDVVSRLSVRAGRCGVLLTTHSMAEAQALCSTIGIMTAGRLRCLGSPQHLKTRFGAALELEVRLVRRTARPRLGISTAPVAAAGPPFSNCHAGLVIA